MNMDWSREQQSSGDRECIEYFRERSVFRRIFCGFREKYISYGRFSGTVKLRNLSEEERDDLEGFFQSNFHGQKSITISAERFTLALKDSRFGCLEPEKVLELYFSETVRSRKEQMQEEEEKWQKLLTEMKELSLGTPAEAWITDLQQAEGGAYAYLQKRCREAGKVAEGTEELIRLGIKMINGLPYRRRRMEYLAVFSASMTGNPHSFDDGTRDGLFFQMLVQWDTQRRGISVVENPVFASLKKQKLYLSAGILRDDISNCVMLSGVHAWKEDGQIHEGMEGFCREGEPVEVPLSVIAEWKQVKCPDQEIYIVENPSVFAMLCGQWGSRKACMCMNGQPRLSALLVLDLLAKAGVKLYYAGDFDPEGILIAWKVKNYYQGEAVYWHMSPEEYMKSRSGEQISDRRMKMLEKVDDPELSELVHVIQENGVAGYQENIWEVYGDSASLSLPFLLGAVP